MFIKKIFYFSIENKKKLNFFCFKLFYKFFFFKFDKLFLINYSFFSLKFMNFMFFYIFNSIQTNLIKSFFCHFIFLNLIGLGFKVFKYKNFLIFKLGFSHFLKIKIPKEIDIFSRYRSSLILYSSNKNILFNYLKLIYNLKSFNFYKGKGFSLLRKSNIILKVGKQQQN